MTETPDTSQIPPRSSRPLHIFSGLKQDFLVNYVADYIGGYIDTFKNWHSRFNKRREVSAILARYKSHYLAELRHVILKLSSQRGPWES